MTPKQFKNLTRGDIVRHVGGADSLVVESNHGDHVIAVRCAELTNHDEWDLVFKATHKEPKIRWRR